MANTVYDSKSIELQDGTKVTLVPLAIGLLRKFMTAWKEGFAQIAEDKDADEDAVYDVYIHCAGIALSKQVKDVFEETLDEDAKLNDEYRVWLEDVLDEQTILEILEICGNLKLRDPKFMEEAAKLSQTEDGKA